MKERVVKLPKILLHAIALGIGLAAFTGTAQVPGIINHQGKLTVNGVTFTGTAQFKFALVNAAGDQTYWSCNNTSIGGAEPEEPAIPIEVSRGVFAVNLGDITVTNMTQSIPSSVFTNREVYLRIWVNDGEHGFQQLIPDRRLVAVPYALSAENITGNLKDAQLSSNIARLDSAQHFGGSNNFAGVAWITNSANQLAGQFSGDGAGLSNLHAAKLTGTVADARLSTNVSLLDANQIFTGANTFAGAASLTNQANLFAGRHSGDGSGLTNLNAAQLTGSLPPAMASSLLPPGSMLVSSSAQDAALIAGGYRLTMTVPAPAWVNGNSSNAPLARYGHSAIWDGQEMIVWGGKVGSSLFTAGGNLYSPDADQWTSVSTINAPAARSEHTSVWSGSEMIVWGGYGASTYLATGGRFQPSPQQWQSISTNNAPAERKGHVAVWTGGRMVIWGGQNGDGLLQDGALYDPVSNNWTALTLPNTPAQRRGAVAVWAGDRLLIWGGEGAAGCLNTGAQLLFSNGIVATQWVAINASNAPAARYGHSAVWTGDQMLVWGGLGSNGSPLASGGAYDPASDTWTVLSSTNAPAARYGHNALWTGQELLILNGTGASGELASGAAYDPLLNRWRALSQSGSPQARTEAAAVWSGTEVLVFGGRANSQILGSLQRLVPQPIWYFYRKL